VHAFVVVLLALSALGCASRPPLITSLPSLEEQEAAAARRAAAEGTTEDPLAQLTFSEGKPLSEPIALPPTGNIALVMADIAPIPRFQRPFAVGAAEGAMRGALVGATVPLMFSEVLVQGGAAHGDRGGLILVGAGLAVIPVGAAIGAGIGALAAPSREEVERGTQLLERAFADMRVSDTLVSQIQEAARSHPILVLSVQGSRSPAPAPDTVLEIDAPRVSLTSFSANDWIPDLRLRVGLWVRLLRASDGQELARWWWERSGSTARLADWSKDDAALFRAELEHALETVALRAVDALLPRPAPARERRAPSLCGARSLEVQLPGELAQRRQVVAGSEVVDQR